MSAEDTTSATAKGSTSAQSVRDVTPTESAYPPPPPPPAKSLPDTSARSGFFRNFFLLSCRSHFTHLHHTVSNSGGHQASSCPGNYPKVFLDRSDRFERHPVGSVVPPAFIGQTRRLINPLTTQRWVRVFIRSPMVLFGVRRRQGPDRLARSVGGGGTTATRVSESTGITDPGG